MSTAVNISEAEQNEESSAFFVALAERGELVTLADCRKALESAEGETGKDAKLFEVCDQFYGELVRSTVRRLLYMADQTYWDSKDCKTLRALLGSADPEFQKFNEEAYRRFLKSKSEPPEPEISYNEYYTDIGSARESGYASDDSDDEDTPPPKSTFRRHPKLEPAPDLILQRVKSNKSGHDQETMKASVNPTEAELARRLISGTIKEGDAEDEERRKGFDYRDARLKQEQRDNAMIYYSLAQWTVQAEKDFLKARSAFAKGDLKAIQAIPTKFCIAQYRGITYKTNDFGAAERRASREREELRQAIYSMAVFAAAGVSPSDYFEGACTKDELERLHKEAEELKAVLVKKREKREYKVSGYTFDCAADALQHIYTNDYDYFHSLIWTYLDYQRGPLSGDYKEPLILRAKFVPKKPRSDKKSKKSKDEEPSEPAKDEELSEQQVDELYAAYLKEYEQRKTKSLFGFVPPPEWDLMEGLKSGRCPFVSCGDVPRHALKYAYGMKFYKGHYGERLKPRWNDQGIAEHPYSGKVFVTLHSLENYLDENPIHVTSANLAGRIQVADMIAEERETTFPAYIGADRLVIEHIAKYPSFPGASAQAGYERKVHLRKYGLDEEDFAIFHAAVREDHGGGKTDNPPKAATEGAKEESAPDEPKEEEGFSIPSYHRIGAWLVNYHEARLLELARRSAENSDPPMILVYRDAEGNLSRDLPPTSTIDAVRFAVRKKVRDVQQLRKDRTFKDTRVDKKSVKTKSDALGKKSSRQAYDNVVTGQYVRHETTGDGNCLFHALGAALASAGYNATPTDHVSIRQETVDAYAAHVDLVASQRISAAYRQQMRQPAVRAGQISRWGSDAEIMAFCRRYRVRVTVFSPTYPAEDGYKAEFEWATDPAGAPPYTIRVEHTAGNHWQWLTPVNVQ